MISDSLGTSVTPRRTLPERLIDFLAVVFATGFVLWYLRPDLLTTPTVATGGDMASHYYTAWWMRHELLPHGRLSGWVPGNYGGFPLFQAYFPLPFVLMAGVSLLTGLPVAFKLGTVAGLVALPAATYVCFRSLRLPFPAPALAAALSVLFLFHEANSVWGGNVASTLAGEFTYSIGVALLVVFCGTLYRGVITGRNWVGNAVLLAAIGLCHAYTLLAAGAFGAYLLLFDPAGRRGLSYLARVAALAFGLVAFWAVPLLAHADYTTAYSVVWPVGGFAALFPPILWPALALLGGAAGLEALERVRGRHTPLAHSLADHRIRYLASLALAGSLLYLVGWRIDVVDIRFLPFVQLTVVLLAAVPAARMAQAAGRRRHEITTAAVSLLMVAATLAWAASRIGFVPDWVSWNYGGFERTPGWAAYEAVNNAVSRTAAEPRVAYEHTPAHTEAGTVRAFESLPLFSGASTLEGLYMQSTISSPFVFYVQSEISQVPSCPLLPYHCGRLNAARAAEHLRLFNVSTIITRSDRVKTELDASTDFRATSEISPYRLYDVQGADGAYVVPLRYEPLVLTTADWKPAFFEWFKRPGSGSVPLVHAPGDAAPAGLPSLTRITDLPADIPRRPLTQAVTVTSRLAPEEIRIRTSRPGHPLLVKVSYHPRWQVEGAAAVWMASPSFMLVVPQQEEVRLIYGSTYADRLGQGLTAIAIALVLVLGARLGARRSRPPRAMSGISLLGRWLDPAFAARRYWAMPLVAALGLAAIAVRLSWVDPWVPHRQGLDRFRVEEYAEAERLFEESIAAAPSSAAAYYSDYYFALCAFRTARWQDTLTRFAGFARRYPDGELVAEAHFRIAEALQGLGRPGEALTRFERVVNEFPDTQWSEFADERLLAARQRGSTGGSAP